MSANTSNTTRSIKKKGLQINFIIIFLNFDLAEPSLSLGSVISLHRLSHLLPLRAEGLAVCFIPVYPVADTYQFLQLSVNCSVHQKPSEIANRWPLT